MNIFFFVHCSLLHRIDVIETLFALVFATAIREISCIKDRGMYHSFHIDITWFRIYGFTSSYQTFTFVASSLVAIILLDKR